LGIKQNYDKGQISNSNCGWIIRRAPWRKIFLQTRLEVILLPNNNSIGIHSQNFFLYPWRVVWILGHAFQFIQCSRYLSSNNEWFISSVLTKFCTCHLWWYPCLYQELELTPQAHRDSIKLLQENKFYVNISKCNFGQK